MNCDDLLLGGTLSSAGITGNVSINNTAMSVADWSSLFGTVGMSGSLAEVYGRPGSYMAGDRLPRSRFSTLSVNIHRYPADIENCTTSDLALMENTDDFLQLLSNRNGTYLEVVMPDASRRFTHVVNLDPAPMLQPTAFRRFNVPLVSQWGHWHQGGTESSQVVSGATSLVVGGTQTIYDAVLTFSANGTFTHSGLGWAIQITGAGGGPVVVHLGQRTVTLSGNPATNRMRRTTVEGDGRIWGWFNTGSNSVTSTVSVTVTWRNQWL
jgi:hypothetical protein